jgi:hypothetical protein
VKFGKSALAAVVVGMVLTTTAGATSAPLLFFSPQVAGSGDAVSAYGRSFCGAAGCSSVTITLGRTVLARNIQVQSNGEFGATIHVVQPPGLYNIVASQRAADDTLLKATAGLRIVPTSGDTTAPPIATTKPPPATTAPKAPPTTHAPPPTAAAVVAPTEPPPATTHPPTTHAATTSSSSPSTTIAGAAAPASSDSSGGSSPWPWVIVAVVVLGSAALGWWFWRRTRLRHS